MNPLDSPAAIRRGLWLRRARRWLVYIVAFGVLADRYGVPSVRLNSGSRAYYVTLEGSQMAHGRSPLVSLQTLKKPVLAHAQALWKEIRHVVQD